MKLQEDVTVIDSPSFSFLAKLSVTLYFVSLFLPAIDNWFGLKVLIVGAMYSWVDISTWGYFANLCFIYIIVKYKDKPQGSAVLLMLFILITPFAGIESWGWGAIMWLIANVMLASDVFLQGKRINPRTQVVIGILIVSMFVLPSGFLSLIQNNLATDSEKEQFLKNGTAFTTKPIMGIEKTPPPPLVLDENTVVEVIGSMNGNIIVDGDFSIRGPAFYQFNNQFVQTFETNHSSKISVFGCPKSVDYFFGIKQREDNKKVADIFILDKHKHLIWQASVKNVKERLGQKYPSLLPRHISYDYWEEVQDKIDYEDGKQLIQGRELSLETAFETCPVHPEHNEEKNTYLAYWKNKVIEFDEKYGAIKTAYCSENYLFFITRVTSAYNNPSITEMNIIVFDRISLYPLYRFTKGYTSYVSYDVDLEYLIKADENFSSINSITFTPYEYLKEDEKLTIDTQKNGVVIIESSDLYN